MRDFILRKILLRGNGKRDSELEFKRGVNLITGGSDSGKTFVFDLINYVLGATNPPEEIPLSRGYNLALLEIEIDGKIQTLIRMLDELEFVYVYFCAIQDLTDSSTYKKCQSNTNGQNSISKYLMNLLDYNEPIILKSTNGGKKQQLTFRLLMKNFAIT